MGTLVLRPYKMSQDLASMYALGEAAYVEDYARIGVSATAGIDRERRVAAIVSALSKVFPILRDVSPGFVWTDDGRIVSFVHFARRGMAGDAWSIETVMTHPDYQRRGLARRLVEASLDEIRRRGGKTCTLKVRADNPPAYRLYESLGFALCDTTAHMRADRQAAIPEPAPQPSCARRLSHREWHRAWAARLDLARRETPPSVQAILPVSPHEYRRPWIVRTLGPVLSRIAGHRVESWVSENGASLVATLLVHGDATGKETHEIRIRVDPAHEPRLAAGLVDQALRSLADLPPRPVLCETRPSNTQLLSALRRHGFDEMATWHALVLRLDGGSSEP